MKIISSILVILSAVFATAQNGAPQRLNYQAIARSIGGGLIINQNISVKTEILEADLTTVVYAETHFVTTNIFGLFTLQIGGGTVVTGSFTAIQWGNGYKFLRTSVDLTGGSNYQVMGTSQFLSVPYALYAEKLRNSGGKTVITLSGHITNAQAQAQIGEEAGPYTQEVRIVGCDYLTSVDLSMLTQLTGLFVFDNPVLTSLNLSSVKEISGDVRIENSPGLSNINFASLMQIASYSSPVSFVYPGTFPSADNKKGFNISGTALTFLSFPSLKTIIGNVFIEKNGFLTSVNFPNLDTASLNHLFSLSDNYLLDDISLPKLKVAGVINTSRIHAITLSIPALASAGFDIRESSLTSLDLPALTSFVIGVKIFQNYLTSITLGSLSGSQAIEMDFSGNMLPSPQINYLLHQFVSITPALTGKTIYLSQTPSAPPTGQGITDRGTLIANGNTIF